MRNHYETLDVAPTATHIEIRASYLRLVKLAHPDVADGMREGPSIETLNAAWSVLKNPLERSRYDRSLNLRRTPCRWCKGTGKVRVMLANWSQRQKPCGSCGGTGKV